MRLPRFLRFFGLKALKLHHFHDLRRLGENVDSKATCFFLPPSTKEDDIGDIWMSQSQNFFGNDSFHQGPNMIFLGFLGQLVLRHNSM